MESDPQSQLSGAGADLVSAANIASPGSQPQPPLTAFPPIIIAVDNRSSDVEVVQKGTALPTVGIPCDPSPAVDSEIVTTVLDSVSEHAEEMKGVDSGIKGPLARGVSAAHVVLNKWEMGCMWAVVSMRVLWILPTRLAVMTRR